MKSIFSYDSKLMQSLMVIGDYIILNLLFVLCSLPLFTIGAAQAGLYSAIRVLQDKEDNSSLTRAFFKGFRTGFGTVTLVWCVFFVCMGLLVYNLVLVLLFHYAGGHAPLLMSIAALALCILFQSMTTLFHSRFSCTAWQLVRNAWFLVLAHPLRAVLVAVMTWLPLLVALSDPFVFMSATPFWLVAYYSLAFRLNFSVMKKPFQELIDQFLEAHGDTPSEES